MYYKNTISYLIMAFLTIIALYPNKQLYNTSIIVGITIAVTDSTACIRINESYVVCNHGYCKLRTGTTEF